VSRRGRELTGTGDRGRQDDLARAGDPGQRLGEAEQRRRGLELQRGDEYDARPRHARGSMGRLEIERRIVLKDRALEFLKLCSRLDSEFIDKGRTSYSVSGERVGLAATAVESEHLQRTRPLAERVLGRERLELTDELGVASARKVGRDSTLECHEPELVEPGGCLTQQSLVGDVRQGRPAP
jgi:hypothetical protein